MRTDEIIEELEELEKTFDEKKESLARDKGRLESLEDRMEKDFGVKTLKKAESELARLDENIETDEKELHEKYAEMKEKMGKIDV